MTRNLRHCVFLIHYLDCIVKLDLDRLEWPNLDKGEFSTLFFPFSTDSYDCLIFLYAVMYLHNSDLQLCPCIKFVFINKKTKTISDLNCCLPKNSKLIYLCKHKKEEFLLYYRIAEQLYVLSVCASKKKLKLKKSLFAPFLSCIEFIPHSWFDIPDFNIPDFIWSVGEYNYVFASGKKGCSIYFQKAVSDTQQAEQKGKNEVYSALYVEDFKAFGKRAKLFAEIFSRAEYALSPKNKFLYLIESKWDYNLCNFIVFSAPEILNPIVANSKRKIKPKPIPKHYNNLFLSDVRVFHRGLKAINLLSDDSWPWSCRVNKNPIHLSKSSEVTFLSTDNLCRLVHDRLLFYAVPSLSPCTFERVELISEEVFETIPSHKAGVKLAGNSLYVADNFVEKIYPGKKVQQ